MKKVFFYFSFSYLKPYYYWPLRIMLILYLLIIFTGLIYDLNTQKIEYYSNTDEYLNILFTDPLFYYIYILPFFGVYFISVLLEFFISINVNKKKTKKPPLIKRRLNK